MQKTGVSIIIPAYNEKDGIVSTLENIRSIATRQGWDFEVFVVDDGSQDETASLAASQGVNVIRHPTNAGYGRSLQDGIRAAHYDVIAITDADGTYPAERLADLVPKVANGGFDMAVGARQGKEYKKGFWKYPARIMFRLLAEYVAGRRIPDINSGLRAFRRDKLMPHLHRTCHGFSFTTSITLIYMLNGFFVEYIPIAYAERQGRSKVRHLRDTLRTAQILISLIAAYNPLKLYLLLAFLSGLVGTLFLLGHLAVGSYWSAWAAVLFWVTVLPIFALGCLAESVRVNLNRNYD